MKSLLGNDYQKNQKDEHDSNMGKMALATKLFKGRTT